MGTSENFCLRWNDFEANVSGAFRDLRAESDFFDVTLGCSDSNGRSLQAHKVILSACSSFFKQMLRQQQTHNPAHPHPYIYLRGVSYCDLSSVLDFMYHGEVNVAQEDLNSFLAVAEELQIKGLTNKEGEPTKKPVKRTGEGGTPAVKRPRRSSPVPTASTSGGNNADGGDVKDVVNIKSDPEAGPSSGNQSAVTGASNDGDYGDEDYGEGDYSQDYGYEDNGEGGDMMGGADVSVEGGEDGGGKGGSGVGKGIVTAGDGSGKTICLICGQKFSQKWIAKRHIRELHSGSSERFECHICHRNFGRKRNRTYHLYHVHGISAEKTT